MFLVFRKHFKKICLVNMFVCVIILKYFNWSIISIDKNIKYVLLWPPTDTSPFFLFDFGQSIIHRCPVSRCYFTKDKELFGGELKGFDAILFNPNERDPWYENNLPTQRFAHQKYVFVASESAYNNPICTTIYKNFFNWTWTYKLNSDCIYKYFSIRNKKGEIVGPMINMSWNDMPDAKNNSTRIGLQNVGYRFQQQFKTKKKAAAWFVSNCKALNHRRRLVNKLQNALKKYNLTIDIYGHCGNLKCSRSSPDYCDEMLKREYYFYIAFENSVCEDYVTEKVLHGTQHLVIPIVLGGAHYDKFLPPNSYLDYQKQSPEKLAYTMNNLIKNPELYSQYFKWTLYYEYANDGFFVAICDFCKMLNDKNKMQKSTVYKDIRKWWNPHQEKARFCSQQY